MNKYNWNKLNESFFDDIENDIVDNDIITNKALVKLYGPTNFNECETGEDYAAFIYNNIHLLELWDLFWKHKEGLMRLIKRDHGIRHFSIKPPKLGIYKKYLNFDTIYKISIKNDQILFTNDNNPTITVCVRFGNFSLDSLSLSVYCNNYIVCNMYTNNKDRIYQLLVKTCNSYAKNEFITMKKLLNN